MAAPFDVTGRLAEAQGAVEHTQSYVWACHLVDYQHPELTSHPAQVRDWFGSEAGMDLHALEMDHAALQEVSRTADEALALQRQQLDRVAAAWEGAGARSADDFLRRHCEAAEAPAASLRTAVQALAGLRETLWRVVDQKVATVVGIDERRGSERSAWLAAAQTVTTGDGDRAAASELVNQQIKPFVDKDIRGDWLAVVHAAAVSIDRGYQASVAELTAGDPQRFEIPRELGPEQPAYEEPSTPRGPESAPAPAPAPAPAAAPAMAPEPAPSYPPATMPSTGAPAAPAMPAMPGGLPAAGPMSAPALPTLPSLPTGDLGALGQQVADALSGLLPSQAENGLHDPGPSDPTKPDPANPLESDRAPEQTEAERQAEHIENPTAITDPIPAADPATRIDVDPAVPTPPVPDIPPDPPPDPPPDAPPPGAVDTATPCEIAADQLPQAGQ